MVLLPSANHYHHASRVNFEKRRGLILGATALLRSLNSHAQWVSSVAWLPGTAASDGGGSPSLLLSTSYDGGAMLWDIRSRVPLHTLSPSHTPGKALVACWWASSNSAVASPMANGLYMLTGTSMLEIMKALSTLFYLTCNHALWHLEIIFFI